MGLGGGGAGGWGVSRVAGLLDGRLALLAGGDRLAAGRHRSLAAAAQWSYELLAQDEQRVFRHLSVFPAPLTLEAAEAGARPGAAQAGLGAGGGSPPGPPPP